MLGSLLGPQIAALRLTLRANLRRATWGAAGGILILLGVTFFGLAILILLAQAVGVVAALLIAGFALILLGLAARSYSRYPPRVAPRPTAAPIRDPMVDPMAGPVAGAPLTAATIINAVVMGIAAGRAVRRRDRL